MVTPMLFRFFKKPMLMVSVSHVTVHDNTSGHLQLVTLRLDLLKIMSVLVILFQIASASHHLWVETISVSQELTLGMIVPHSIQMLGW